MGLFRQLYNYANTKTDDNVVCICTQWSTFLPYEVNRLVNRGFRVVSVVMNHSTNELLWVLQRPVCCCSGPTAISEQEPQDSDGAIS